MVSARSAALLTVTRSGPYSARSISPALKNTDAPVQGLLLLAPVTTCTIRSASTSTLPPPVGFTSHRSDGQSVNVSTGGSVSAPVSAGPSCSAVVSASLTAVSSRTPLRVVTCSRFSRSLHAANRTTKPTTKIPTNKTRDMLGMSPPRIAPFESADYAARTTGQRNT